MPCFDLNFKHWRFGIFCKFNGHQNSSLSSLSPASPAPPSVCHPPPARPPARLLLQTQLRGRLDSVEVPHRRECDLRRQNPITLPSLFLFSVRPSAYSLTSLVAFLISHPPTREDIFFSPLLCGTRLSPFLFLNTLFPHRLIRTGIESNIVLHLLWLSFGLKHIFV